MKLYRRVNVCGLSYEVYFASAEEVPNLSADEARTEYQENRIYIRESLRNNPTRVRDNLVHELQHAILEASGLGAWMRAHTKLSKAHYIEFEELLIRIQTPALITTLQSAGLLKGIK